MYEKGGMLFGRITAGTAKSRFPFNSRFQQTEKHSKTTLMILNKRTCLIILSLLSLVKSSTTTRSPDLLLVVLLFLQHLTSLSLVLLNSELHGQSHTHNSYSGQAVLGLELLNVIERIVDQSKAGRTTTS